MGSFRNSVLELADKHLGEYKIRGDELICRVCPWCGGGEHNDLETFAINLNTGLWNCRRGSCTRKSGTIKELCDMFGEETIDNQIVKYNITKKKNFVKPDPAELHELTDGIVTFFNKRKISRKTLEDWKIASDANGNIVFPFYRDGVLTYVKYRQPRNFREIKNEYETALKTLPKEEAAKLRKPSKEWQMSNTEPILFGMDMVSFNKPLVICEGEIDALSLYEAGVTNVVSVPCGCENMDWIPGCWDWLDQFNQIVLFGDSDDPGVNMMITLMRRFGEDRCMMANNYPDLVYNGEDYGRACKDANEILYCYGPEELKKIVESCEPSPIKGVLNLASVPFVNLASKPKILTKIPALDFAIGGLMEGGVTVFSGKRGEGKSTVAGTLALNAIQDGLSVCAYSGELPADVYLEWIFLQATESKYIGYKTDERTGKNLACVSPMIQERIRKWIDGKFFLYDNSCIMEEKQDDSIMRVFEACARRYGCKLFICDNLMSALTSADEENKAQAKFTARLKAFASKYKVHVILIAHPRKTKADAVFSNDDVAGSSVITNLADCVINVERPNLRVNCCSFMQ